MNHTETAGDASPHQPEPPLLRHSPAQEARCAEVGRRHVHADIGHHHAGGALAHRRHGQQLGGRLIERADQASTSWSWSSWRSPGQAGRCDPGACGPGGRGGIEATQQGLSQLGDLGPHPGEGHLCQHKSPVPARRPWKLGEDSPIVSDVTGATPSRCARLFALRSARSGELRLLGRLRLD